MKVREGCVINKNSDIFFRFKENIIINKSKIKFRYNIFKTKCKYSDSTDAFKLHILSIRDSLSVCAGHIKSFRLRSLKENFKLLKAKCILHKKGLFRVANVLAPVCAVAVLVLTVGFFNGRDYALVLDYNGETLGTISDEQTLGDVVTDINQNLSSEVIEDNGVNLNAQYTLAPTTASNTDEIKDKIIETSDSNIKQGTGLYVNNQLIGFVDSENADELSSELNNKLESAKSQPNSTAAFYDKVEVKNGIYPNKSYKTEDEMSNVLDSTKLTDIKYTTKEGDTINSIASLNGVSSDVITAKNPQIEESIAKDNSNSELDVNDQKLNTGTELIIEKEIPFLPVKLTTQQSYTAAVPFEKEEQPNDQQYQGYSLVKQEGVNGSSDCIDEVTTINGIEIGRTSISKVTTVEPIKQITEIGTKALPDTPQYAEASGVMTGRFMWPVPECNVISSPFGERWGTMHKGIDIAGGLGGQTIVASDGGTVVKAANTGDGYGNCVIIQHNDQYSTLYGHCADLLVSEGDTVQKGQPIATVGSTGDSTGPHLHFEVRIDGTQVDPEPYLNKNDENVA